MNDYLLFIDTETTGLPQRWDVPYAVPGNWPSAVQVAWVVCSRNGQEIKAENHYIQADDCDISPAAFRIHGISKDFLRENGKSRAVVLNKLKADLNQYQPLVVGHFMQLDYHIIGADTYRLGWENPLQKSPTFCTMLATAKYVSNPRSKYLRLDRLYYVLFNQDLAHPHEALADARATAACFFEMVKLGDITEAHINQQQQAPPNKNEPGWGCGAFLLLATFFTYLYCYWP